MPSTVSTCRSMFTKSSSPSRIAAVRPLSSGDGGGAALVGEPELAEPLVARPERDEHVLVAGQLGDALGRRLGRVDEAERGEDAAGLGPRLGDLVGRVGVAHQRGAGRHDELALRRDVGGADDDRAVRGRRAVGVAAEEGEGGAVVAASLGLVLLDQPAGVLDRRPGDGGGVHRVAQHLADVAGGAAGEEVLGVHEVRHRLEERAEHLTALVADVAHHLELLVDDHEELVDLLLVGQELQQPPLALVLGEAAEPEGAADRVHPDVAAVHRDVPLGAGADEVAVTGEEAVGPVGALLASRAAGAARSARRRVPSRGAGRGTSGRRRGWRPRRCRSRRR